MRADRLPVGSDQATEADAQRVLDSDTWRRIAIDRPVLQRMQFKYNHNPQQYVAPMSQFCAMACDDICRGLWRVDPLPSAAYWLPCYLADPQDWRYLLRAIAESVPFSP